MTPRVVLYVTPTCGLCDEAREILTEAGVGWEERTDDRFVVRAPVVEIDGAIVTEGRVSALAVRRALRRARRAQGG